MTNTTKTKQRKPAGDEPAILKISDAAKPATNAEKRIQNMPPPAAGEKPTVPILSGIEGLGSKVAIVPIPIAVIERHPANRKPSDAAIAEIEASFRNEGVQLEAAVVRRLPGRTESYQVLSGETRLRAAKKAGWKTLDCRIVDCDDAQALRLVATYNAKRRDLNALERAELLKRLTDPIAQGGAGLTHDQAGDDVGLSRGAVSNELRLLRLPAGIQDAIRDGRLPATFARELIGGCDGPGAAVIEKAVAKVLGKKKESIEEEFTRNDFVDAVHGTVGRECHRMKAADKWDRDNEWTLGQNDTPYSPRYFEAGDEQLRKLGVFKFGDEEFAANTQLWRTLNGEAKKKLLDGLKSKAGKKGDRADAKKKPAAERSPAEQKAAKKERDAQFARRLDAFRVDWLRVLVAARLRDFKWCKTPAERLAREATIQRLLLWGFVDDGREPNDSYSAGGAKFHHRDDVEPFGKGRGSRWDRVAAIPADDLDDTIAVFLAGQFVDAKEGPSDTIPAEVVRAVAKLLSIDLTAAWKSERAGDLTHRFFTMLTREQLVAEAEAWKTTEVKASAKVSEIVTALMIAPRSFNSLPLVLRAKR